MARWIWLVVFTSLISSTYSLGEVVRRAQNRQYYNDYSNSGYAQSGQAQSNRQVYQYDGRTRTDVRESYQRQHRYQVTSPSANTSGAFGGGGQASRTYQHNGDPETIQRMNEHEQNRLSILAQVDALTTRAEKQKAFVIANRWHTQTERANFLRELDRIDYEIGLIGKRLGSRSLSRNNPDQSDEKFKKLDEIILRLEWSSSPNVFTQSAAESHFKKIDWTMRYLSELRTSLNTAFAAYQPEDRRDRMAELDAIIKRLEANK